MASARPDIFTFHDYQQFLKDMLEWIKTSDENFSMRNFADTTGLSQSWLSMVFGGTRKMTLKGLSKLASAMKLETTEKKFLELLWHLSESKTNGEKLHALTRIQKFGAYKNKDHGELESHKYLNKWYYVAIREMAEMKTFKADAKWIQSQLRFKLSLKEINQALEFLFEHEYLIKKAGGKVVTKERQIDCHGGVYRVSLASFHKQMFGLVERSITEVPREEREIIGHTFAINESQLAALKAAMNETLEKIVSQEGDSTSKDAVYHITLAAIPLTEKA